MKKIPISVVIPAFYSERFIGEAIESILSRTLPPDEIIFADKNCVDGTRKFVQGSSAKIVKKNTKIHLLCKTRESVSSETIG